MAIAPESPYFLGVLRPTIPLAELSTFILSLLYAPHESTYCYAGLGGGADGLYALRIVLHGFATTIEVTLVLLAKPEAREAIRNWHLARARAPAHAGSPPPKKK